jgi:hypothetical protein
LLHLAPAGTGACPALAQRPAACEQSAACNAPTRCVPSTGRAAAATHPPRRTSRGVNFTLHNNAVQMVGAEATCQSLGGHLASYTSEYEQHEVEQAFVRGVRGAAAHRLPRAAHTPGHMAARQLCQVPTSAAAGAASAPPSAPEKGGGGTAAPAMCALEPLLASASTVTPPPPPPTPPGPPAAGLPPLLLAGPLARRRAAARPGPALQVDRPHGRRP